MLSLFLLKNKIVLFNNNNTDSYLTFLFFFGGGGGGLWKIKLIISYIFKRNISNYIYGITDLFNLKTIYTLKI